MPVVIGGDNLPSPVRIGLTDLPNIGGASGPPGSGTTDKKARTKRTAYVVCTYVRSIALY